MDEDLSFRMLAQQAKACAVLEDAGLRMGAALANLGRKAGLTDEDLASIERLRDRSPAEPGRFE